MLDIGWQELLVIGALALIVVGPKDLPGMLRSFGQWVGRLRGMATDFQRAMRDAAREADMGNLTELRDLKDSVSGSLDYKAQAAKAQSFLNTDGIKSETKKAEAKTPETKPAESGTSTASKTAAKKTPAKKANAKNSAAAKTTAKKAPAKKPAAKKPAAVKPAARKTVTRKTPTPRAGSGDNPVGGPTTSAARPRKKAPAKAAET